MDDLLCNEGSVLSPTRVADSSAESLTTLVESTVAPLATVGEGPGAMEELRNDRVGVIRLLVKRESRYCGRNPQYLTDVQRHGMEAAWRRKICRWMFEMAKAFELTKDTVGCAVYIVDYYLSTTSADKIMLQLVSMTAMYISSKMHEHHPISMEEIDMLCQRKFKRGDIRHMESQLLELLNWRLSPPVSFTFARDFIQILNVSAACKSELEDSAMELLQKATEDFSSVRFQSSSVGMAAVQIVCSARKLRPATVVQDALHCLDVTGDDFIDCFRWLRDLRCNTNGQLRFVSVEVNKSASRSISPTSVEESGTLSQVHGEVAGKAPDNDDQISDKVQTASSAVCGDSQVSGKPRPPTSASCSEETALKRARHNSR